MWINSGDIILLGLRDYQDTKADVILKYTPDEARNLKTYGELPETGKSYLVFNYSFEKCKEKISVFWHIVNEKTVLNDFACIDRRDFCMYYF